MLGLDEQALPAQHDQAGWPLMKQRFAEVFKTRSQAEWAASMQSCIVLALPLGEAPRHVHIQQRGSFVEVDGVVQPAPAPHFSRTPGAIQNPPPRPGQDTNAVLGDWGFSAEEQQTMHAAGAVL